MLTRWGKTVVSTNPVAASLDARNYEDPLSFKPERWLGDNKTDKLEASQPFSLGPRGCLGRRYVLLDSRNNRQMLTGKSLGWMELRTVLAKLHYKCSLELVNTDLNWQDDSKMHTLWQKPKMKVRVSQRRKD